MCRPQLLLFACVVASFSAAGAPSPELPPHKFAQELERLALQVLPALHHQDAKFHVRGLALTPGGRIAVIEDSLSSLSQPRSFIGACILLDVYSAPPRGDHPDKTSRIDAEALGKHPEQCASQVLWARGRGGMLDWMSEDTASLCGVYNALLLEDEFLLDIFRKKPPGCPVYPVDPHEVERAELQSVPFAPGKPLPAMSKAFVSFHAYSVFHQEGHGNPQRWLQNPDFWNSHFMALMQAGHLHICVKEKDCEGDNRPFRLMFWEDISHEFLNCVMRGITPIFFATSSIIDYVERNVLLLPYGFQDADDMVRWVTELSSPEGLQQHGVRAYMQRQSNHLLANLYWRQDARTRALVAASDAHKRRGLESSIAKVFAGVNPGAELSSDVSSYVADFVICVMSAVGNKRLRAVIRETWGHNGGLPTSFGMVRIRVLFFVGDATQASDDQEEAEDIVYLHGLQESFDKIWLKTAAILKFGADFFQGRLTVEQAAGGRAASGTSEASRFLIKCDDDTFVDIDAVVADILASPSVGLYWGHVMALVQPNRAEDDKYFVPREVYPMDYYPPYARGMLYALSEDLVGPLGTALAEGRVDPFPYREDVSVGLYLLALARHGEIRVVPKQQKDLMPLDFKQHCAEDGFGALLVLHRYPVEAAHCLWHIVIVRRSRPKQPLARPPSGKALSGATPPNPTDFCACLADTRVDGV